MSREPINKSLVDYVNFIKKAFGESPSFPKELDNLTLFEENELTKEELAIFRNAYKRVEKKTYMKNCFLNSLQLCNADKTGTIKIVEGYAFCYIPMEHSWNTINGKLIDITFNIAKGEEPYLGKFPEDIGYYGHIFDGLDTKAWYKFSNRRNDFSLLGLCGRDFLKTN